MIRAILAGRSILKDNRQYISMGKPQRIFYVDETAHPGVGKHGIGILMSHGPPPTGLIPAAMTRLEDMCRERPEGKAAQIAAETLSRGYFHSRDDGVLARTALLDEIKNGLHGHCDFFLANTAALVEDGHDNETAWRLISQVVPSVASTYEARPLVVMGARQRFSAGAAENWHKTALAELAERRTTTEAHLPFHPDLDGAIRVGSPADIPGLQIIDALLWHFIRGLSEGNEAQFLDDVFESHRRVEMPLAGGITAAMASLPSRDGCPLCCKT
jgi:hypothetical protein